MTQRLAKKILRDSSRYSLAQLFAAERLWARNLERYINPNSERWAKLQSFVPRWGRWDPNPR